MKTRIRFPDLRSSQDLAVREWANELTRALVAYTEESIFSDVVAIVTAGNNIELSVESTPEKIYINANVSVGGGGITEASADAKYQLIGDYLTSSSAHTAFLTTAELSSHDYITSNETSAMIAAAGGGGVTSAQVCALVEAYGYISANAVSSTYLTKASSSAFTKVAEVCALVEAYNYLVSTSNVSAGTYGTSTIIPQIVVNTAGLITDIVRVTAPAGGGGATTLDGLTDVSTVSAVSGQYLMLSGSEWLPKTPALIYSNMTLTTAESSNIVEATISGWDLTLPASGVYNIEWTAWVYAGSVPDVKFNLGKSDTNTTGRYCNENTVLTLNTVTSVNTAITLAVPGSTFYNCSFQGWIITAASTTKAWVTFAQGTSTGATLSKLLPGSWLKVWKG